MEIEIIKQHLVESQKQYEQVKSQLAGLEQQKTQMLIEALHLEGEIKILTKILGNDKDG